MECSVHSPQWKSSSLLVYNPRFRRLTFRLQPQTNVDVAQDWARAKLPRCLCVVRWVFVLRTQYAVLVGTTNYVGKVGWAWTFCVEYNHCSSSNHFQVWMLIAQYSQHLHTRMSLCDSRGSHHLVIQIICRLRLSTMATKADMKQVGFLESKIDDEALELSTFESCSSSRRRGQTLCIHIRTDRREGILSIRGQMYTSLRNLDRSTEYKL